MGELVKVRLLNGGGYDGMSSVQFPIAVDGTISTSGRMALLDNRELELIGCDMNEFTGLDNGELWPFWIGESCEIIND